MTNNTDIHIIAASEEIKDKTPAELNEELTILSGKFGGTCYAKEGYETIRKQPVEKAIKRAENTAKSGHHSVYQHAMVTMEVQCSKILAMLLNSIGVSNTSEKSARYTKMKPQSELEEQLYYKWHDIFANLIKKEYADKFTEKEIDKLAFENARYMISVFTPTSMVYSLPFRNIFYVMDWAESMEKNLSNLKGDFNQRLKEEVNGLRLELLKIIGNKQNFHDNKNEYFRFMPVQATGMKEDDSKDIYGDVYTSNYLASFACVAQEQRHRTLKVKINFSGDDAGEYGFYVPLLIKKYNMEDEWLSDLGSVKDVYPQATLLHVTEQGIFEDFALKCKERMCGRAQLEIMNLNAWMTEQFIAHKEELSNANRKRLENMISDGGKPCARCSFKDFECHEGCKWGPAGALNRLI